MLAKRDFHGASAAAKMAFGSAAGSAIAFVASIALARLFTPEQHGKYAVVAALALILVPLVSGRFEAALPIPGADQDAFRLLNLGIIWSIAWASSITVVIILVEVLLTSAGGSYRLPDYVWFAPWLALLTALLNLLNQYSVRNKRYTLVALRNIGYPSFMALGQVSFGFGGLGAIGLILGTLLGRFASVFVFIRDYLSSRAAYIASDGVSYGGLLRRYRRFPSILAISALINTLGLQLPVILIGYWYGDGASGQYSLSQRTLSIPLALIGAAIGQVYLSEMSRAMREGSARAAQLFDRSTVALGTCGIFVGGILFATGPHLFELVFGDNWTEAGHIGRAMALALVAQLVSSPLSQVLIVYERYWAQFAWDATRLIGVTSALCLAFTLGFELVHAVWLLSIVSVVCFGASWWLSRVTVRSRLKI